MSDPLLNCRKDYPILSSSIGTKPLIYLDNAATTQMPDPVLQEIIAQYHTYQANVHRGIHTLSERSTLRMENARTKIMTFTGASRPEEIIFTSGATASVNMVAHSFRDTVCKEGVEIITTAMEHHANLIPWQEACKKTGATLKVVPVNEKGELKLDVFKEMITDNTALVALTWVSNVTGAINPVKEVIDLAHSHGAKVLVDASQAVRHFKLDVKEIDCDFLVFSGHKMMGPTGTGVLYGKYECLQNLYPETYGGGMVDTVYQTSATYGELPFKLEAGTPNISGNIALGAAIDYLTAIGIENISAYESELLYLIRDELRALPFIKIAGDPLNIAGCISFVMDKAHFYDTARLLDQLGVAVRSGHHCAMPYLEALGYEGVVRVSPAFYNTKDEIYEFIEALKKTYSVFDSKPVRRTRRKPDEE